MFILRGLAVRHQNQIRLEFWKQFWNEFRKGFRKGLLKQFGDCYDSARGTRQGPKVSFWKEFREPSYMLYFHNVSRNSFWKGTIALASTEFRIVTLSILFPGLVSEHFSELILGFFPELILKLIMVPYGQNSCQDIYIYIYI